MVNWNPNMSIFDLVKQTAAPRAYARQGLPQGPSMTPAGPLPPGGLPGAPQPITEPRTLAPRWTSGMNITDLVRQTTQPGVWQPPTPAKPSRIGSQFLPFEGKMREVGGVSREDYLRNAPANPIWTAMQSLPKEYWHMYPGIAYGRTPAQLAPFREQGIPIPDYISRRAAQYPRRYAGENVEPLKEDVEYQYRQQRASRLNRMLNSGIPFEQANQLLIDAGMPEPEVPIWDPWGSYKGGIHWMG